MQTRTQKYQHLRDELRNTNLEHTEATAPVTDTKAIDKKQLTELSRKSSKIMTTLGIRRNNNV